MNFRRFQMRFRNLRVNLEQNESSVKTANTSPQVQPPRVGEKRLAYVQGLIDESMGLKLLYKTL